MEDKIKDDFSEALKGIGGIVHNTWAEGLNPTYKAMDPKRAELFVVASFTEIEAKTKSPSEDVTKAVDGEFLIKILNARIEVMKLPITFSLAGKMAALALTDRPGAMVVLLIDCLNAFEGKTIGPGQLADLYPLGFYDEETLESYVENYMKPRKVKWADVYGSR